MMTVSAPGAPSSVVKRPPADDIGTPTTSKNSGVIVTVPTNTGRASDVASRTVDLEQPLAAIDRRHAGGHGRGLDAGDRGQPRLELLEERAPGFRRPGISSSGSCTRIVIRLSVRMPRSTCTASGSCGPSAPAPTSSTIVSASSATTIVVLKPAQRGGCRRCRGRLPSARRCGSHCDTCSAGARPNSTPVSTQSAATYAKDDVVHREDDPVRAAGPASRRRRTAARRPTRAPGR